MHPAARLFVPWYWGIGQASRSPYPKGSSQWPGGVVSGQSLLEALALRLQSAGFPGVAFSCLAGCGRHRHRYDFYCGLLRGQNTRGKATKPLISLTKNA
jgi:hypothetical protein